MTDVMYDSPAWRAGVGPGLKILTVNQQRWSLDAWRQAVANDSKNGGKIAFEVESDSGRKSLSVAYAGPERFPRLEADPARFDMLEDIIRAPRSSVADWKELASNMPMLSHPLVPIAIPDCPPA